MGFLSPPPGPKVHRYQSMREKGTLQSSVICAQVTDSINNGCFQCRRSLLLWGPTCGMRVLAEVRNPVPLSCLPQVSDAALSSELAPLSTRLHHGAVFDSHTASLPPPHEISRRPFSNPMQLSEFRLRKTKARKNFTS